MTRILLIFLFLSIGCDTLTKQDAKPSQSTPATPVVKPTLVVKPTPVEKPTQSELLTAQLIRTQILEKVMIALGVMKPEDAMDVLEMVALFSPDAIDELIDFLKVLERGYIENRELVGKIGLKKFKEKRAAEEVARVAKKALR